MISTNERWEETIHTKPQASAWHLAGAQCHHCGQHYMELSRHQPQTRTKPHRIPQRRYNSCPHSIDEEGEETEEQRYEGTSVTVLGAHVPWSMLAYLLHSVSTS